MDKPLEEVVERVARAMFPQLGQEGWRHYDDYWFGKARAAIEASGHFALRESAEIGLQYVIEAANERSQKDAVFDNAMRDIRRIEAALGADEQAR